MRLLIFRETINDNGYERDMSSTEFVCKRAYPRCDVHAKARIAIKSWPHSEIVISNISKSGALVHLELDDPTTVENLARYQGQPAIILVPLRMHNLQLPGIIRRVNRNTLSIAFECSPRTRVVAQIFMDYASKKYDSPPLENMIEGETDGVRRNLKPEDEQFSGSAAMSTIAKPCMTSETRALPPEEWVLVPREKYSDKTWPTKSSKNPSVSGKRY